MGEQRVFLHELIILVLWLCAPTLFVTIAVQLWLFRRRRVLQRGQAARITIALGGTVLLAPVVSVLFWVILPQALLPGSVMPEGRLPIPPFFLPAILACSIFGSAFTWWIIRRLPA